MIYSPSVVLFRDDRGSWINPLEMDILTSAAVNAGDVRKQIRWEEEMRALRERVRVAELARGRDVPLSVAPAQVRVYEHETQKAKGEETTESAGHSQTPSEVDSVSVPISPIIFASDPDPSPPLQPLSLPPSNLTPLSQPFPSVTASSPHSHSPCPPQDGDLLAWAETVIALTMYERIARILYLFHSQGTRHLVLGSFGTGVFQNSVELVAGIFRDLLCEPIEPEKQDDADQDEAEQKPPSRVSVSSVGKGKFKGAFDTVMFAILGGSTVRTFQQVFEGAEGVELDDEAEGSDIEGMKDNVDFVVRDGRDPA